MYKVGNSERKEKEKSGRRSHSSTYGGRSGDAPDRRVEHKIRSLRAKAHHTLAYARSASPARGLISWLIGQAPSVTVQGIVPRMLAIISVPFSESHIITVLAWARATSAVIDAGLTGTAKRWSSSIRNWISKRPSPPTVSGIQLALSILT